MKTGNCGKWLKTGPELNSFSSPGHLPSTFVDYIPLAEAFQLSFPIS
jgi:hypothetical protein